jgi:hypothetical protein
VVAKLREELAAELRLAVEEGLHEAGEVFRAEGTHRGGEVEGGVEGDVARGTGGVERGWRGRGTLTPALSQRERERKGWLARRERGRRGGLGQR